MAMMPAATKDAEIVAVALSAPRLRACAPGRIVVDWRCLQERAESVSASQVANSSLAGLLAVLLFFSGLLSVSHTAHRLMHPGGSNSHFCFVCSIAKGQVNAADVGPVFVCFIATVLFCIPLLRFSAAFSEDRRLAPSRAPPRCFGLQ
jgi:hypothetical protein